MINISFGVAAAVISLVILLNLRNTRRVQLVHNSLFMWFVLLNMISSVAITIYGAVDGYTDGNILVATLCQVIYYSARSFLFYVSVLYFITMKQPWQQITRKTLTRLLVPGTAFLLLVLSSPWTHIIFEITSNGSCIDGWGHILYYLEIFYYVFYAANYMRTHTAIYTPDFKIAIYMSLFFISLGAIVQYYHPLQMTGPLGIAVGTLYLFLLSQSNDATLDPETNTLNRQTFDDTTSAYYDSKSNFDLLVINIDDAQMVERMVGAKQSDILHRNITSFLKKLYAEGRVYHFRSRAFCLVIPADHTIDSLAEAVLKRFETPWHFETGETLVTARVCRMHCPKDAENHTIMLDLINHFVENVSGERNALASEWDSVSVHRARQLSSLFENGVNEDHVKLYFTPFFSTKYHTIPYAEVSTSILHKELGEISEEEYVPIAESSGLSKEISEIVYKKLFAYLSENPIPQCLFNVKISISHCMQRTFLERITAIADAYHFDISQLVLVISELAISQSPKLMKDVLDTLHSKGFRLCLNEYGSGYSNISCIYDFPFQMVQVDNTMVSSAIQNPLAKITLDSSLTLIKMLGMHTSTTGAAEADQFQMLLGMSCDLIGGGYISHSLVEEEFSQFILDFSPLQFQGVEVS